MKRVYNLKTWRPNEILTLWLHMHKILFPNLQHACTASQWGQSWVRVKCCHFRNHSAYNIQNPYLNLGESLMKVIHIWANAWDFQQYGMCDQQSLRSACAYAQSDQNLCLSLEYPMSVKLLTGHHLRFLSLKGGCTGSSESTLVKMPHCWKSHAAAQLYEIWKKNHVITDQVRVSIKEDGETVNPKTIELRQ